MADKIHDSIYKLYPNVVSTSTTDGKTFECKDKDGNIISIDQSLVDADFAKVEYKNKRLEEYPDHSSQLDYIYHNGIEKWKTDIVDPIKNKYPKPS
tara:strand:+ start:300 stop:587 length:288 start_codon:yes stop_codon:yes gene_type:complete